MESELVKEAISQGEQMDIDPTEITTRVVHEDVTVANEDKAKAVESNLATEGETGREAVVQNQDMVDATA